MMNLQTFHKSNAAPPPIWLLPNKMVTSTPNDALKGPWNPKSYETSSHTTVRSRFQFCPADNMGKKVSMKFAEI